MRDKKLVAILRNIHECLRDIAREDADLSAAMYEKLEEIERELDSTGL